ncbi:hypothetical protein M501DRAFT_1058312 [Patellaria atrata CBS 101060]|uniref:Heat shock factor binding protein 1 n=1 Tax=Patellaria atrata CBS 101060 TaxID=1346257 RepID=A0A9P4S8R8_9PEZI|nr:hypothetical protein M501DRAFT_1058312 [Patellaria atrata CBS 101060]
MSNPQARSGSEASTPALTDAGTAELTAVVDELLNQLTTKFATMSKDLIEKMDDMSRRLDTLESTIQANSTSTKGGDSK